MNPRATLALEITQAKLSFFYLIHYICFGFALVISYLEGHFNRPLCH